MTVHEGGEMARKKKILKWLLGMLLLGFAVSVVFGKIVLGTMISTTAALLLLFLPIYWAISEMVGQTEFSDKEDEKIGKIWLIVALIIIGILLLPFLPALIILLLLIGFGVGVLGVAIGILKAICNGRR